MARRKITTYFPNSGPLRRDLYHKHLGFFAAGPKHRERLMLAANRIGKTESVGGYEMTLHLTGDYPDWWVGRRFSRPVRAWAAGDTSNTVREILQQKLLGPVGQWGTGLIPGDAIERTVRAQGVADTVSVIYVKHKAGGTSTLLFKSYDQRRESFQGTEQDIIWLDEEPPLDIYTECLLRTMTNSGMIMLTFTPLLGMSEVVLQFLPDGKISTENAAKYVVTATWDDAPHLDEAAKKELWASIPPYQRDARSKGVPQLGAGAIFPVPESDLVVEPFKIPEYWPKAYGMDVGWNATACVWGALNRENDTLYLYDAYKRGQAEPDIHASAIRFRGDWICGVIDPASRGRSQRDGSQLVQSYKDLGLNIDFAQNAVEAGIFEVWQRMVTGRLKVFATLSEWLTEFRLYRRDSNGKVVKENDHLMDCTRYLNLSGVAVAKIKPITQEPVRQFYEVGRGDSMQHSNSWMG